MSKEPHDEQEKAARCPPAITATTTKIKGAVRCTFCGADNEHGGKVVIGFGTVVCDRCVALSRAEENDLPKSGRIVPLRPKIVGPGILPTGSCPLRDRSPPYVLFATGNLQGPVDSSWATRVPSAANASRSAKRSSARNADLPYGELSNREHPLEVSGDIVDTGPSGTKPR